MGAVPGYKIHISDAVNVVFVHSMMAVLIKLVLLGELGSLPSVISRCGTALLVVAVVVPYNCVASVRACLQRVSAVVQLKKRVFVHKLNLCLV